MFQSPQQQQQQQQDDSNSNCNVTQPQSEPCSDEEVDAWLTSELDNWLALFATAPNNVTDERQATTVSTPALSRPEQCHTDTHTQKPTSVSIHSTQQQQQQREQQHDSNSKWNSNCKVTQPQSQPCPEGLKAWKESELYTWLVSFPATEEEWEVWCATEPSGLQDKAFESRWEIIAALIPEGKTPTEIRIRRVDSAHYVLDFSEELSAAEHMAAATKADGGTTEQTPPANCSNRRGCHWTEEERRLFLAGLKNCGKGKWKTISRHFVKTRDPQQVASHAQKYFQRQSDTSKKRKRKSIHDITI